MEQIFISYSSKDEKYAERLYNYLKIRGYSIWFAPESIEASADFSKEIGEALGFAKLSDEELVDKRIAKYKASQLVILLLSDSSMKSKWVSKEIKLAINQEKPLIVLRIDHEALSYDFAYMLVDVQMIDAYYLNSNALKELDLKIAEIIQPEREKTNESRRTMSFREIGVESIAKGDPFFVTGQTLKVHLSKLKFYLSPPLDLITDDNREWVDEHFSGCEVLPGLQWEEVFQKIPITDLKERIEKSRHKVFRQFLYQENGCYFNNKKYGVHNIRPYGRTEDLREMPTLVLEFYTTDYFTHRVMKDVCKQLVAEKNKYFIDEIDYTNLGVNSIFFTSMGINLLLKDSENSKIVSTILTERSLNASETNSKQRYSLSVIEGVSLSDYDLYTNDVDLTAAVLRGLQEELGVKDYMVQKDTLHFYDLFVIYNNLEMGLSCTIDLKRDFSIETDIRGLHGKDEQLEVSDKRIIQIDKLHNFAISNQKYFMPQAFFTILSVLEGRGYSLIDRRKKVVMSEECYVCGKLSSSCCGDTIFKNESFIAVIDGATPKGTRLWDGMTGDVFISQYLAKCMEQLPINCTAKDAISYLNEQVAKAYNDNQLDVKTLPVEEQLQASIIIYSYHRKEVWNFGDCRLRINLVNYNHMKKIDRTLSELRAYCLEIARFSKKAFNTFLSNDCKTSQDIGRDAIHPFLKAQILLANTECAFGYDTINGMDNIILDHIKVYHVQSGDHVVLATDGYPELFDTLEETELYLKQSIEIDPDCVNIIMGTKGIQPGWVSFDDRAYLSFVVK